MDMNYKFTVQEAFVCAKQGILEDWVHAFLNSEGSNPEFSEGLKLEKRYWAGPVQMDLHRLHRCCGPEDSMEYKVDAQGFNHRVNSMMMSMQAGWEAPPLIASYDNGVLVINDGNHRYEALQRSGMTQYWVILWGNTVESLQITSVEK